MVMPTLRAKSRKDPPGVCARANTSPSMFFQHAGRSASWGGGPRRTGISSPSSSRLKNASAAAATTAKTAAALAFELLLLLLLWPRRAAAERREPVRAHGRINKTQDQATKRRRGTRPRDPG
ncbi:hypothetical protein DIPPA_18110 [Diplonema papillatum]|nr:hypothetical protein DIPPA_18110 [Diplonema papillatum]